MICAGINMQKSINSEITERESAAGQHAKSGFPPRQMEFCKSPVNPTQIMMISLWTGHEYPFGIKMSHIRDAMPHGSKHCACPRQLQGSFLTEQLPQELQCQFVLKPSRLAVCQQLNGTSQHRSHTARPPPTSALESKRAGMGRVVESEEEDADAPSICMEDFAVELSLIWVCCCKCVIFLSYVLTSCLSNGFSKSSKRKTRSLPCIFFVSLLAELLSAALAVLCSKAGWFTVQESRLDFGAEFPCSVCQHRLSLTAT